MSLNEFDLINTYLRPLATSDDAMGLKNDGAIISFNSSNNYVVSTDTIIENVHFTSDMPIDLVARKCLRVNVSDIVAMGAKPYCYNLALSFPKGKEQKWYGGFFAGLAHDQSFYDLKLLGGDITVHDGAFVLTCTMVGILESGQTVLSRQGAQEDDGIYVTGTIGDAALGLRIATGEANWQLDQKDRDFLLERYYLPQPRLLHAKTIGSFAHSGLDISDGLLQDIGHLTMDYGLGAEIDRAAVPLSVAARDVVNQDEQAWDYILGGGDDYEMVFTSSSHNQQELMILGKMSEVPITHIGYVKGNAIVVLDEDKKAINISNSGYIHY